MHFTKSRFIGPCKSWTDARFGITQFVTANTHVLDILEFRIENKKNI